LVSQCTNRCATPAFVSLLIEGNLMILILIKKIKYFLILSEILI
jgi:hypothetical protein